MQAFCVYSVPVQIPEIGIVAAGRVSGIDILWDTGIILALVCVAAAS